MAVLHTSVQPGCQEQQIGAADKPKRRQSLGTGLKEESTSMHLAADLKLFSSSFLPKDTSHSFYTSIQTSVLCILIKKPDHKDDVE